MIKKLIAATAFIWLPFFTVQHILLLGIVVIQLKTTTGTTDHTFT
jgi:hypothetical protein